MKGTSRIGVALTIVLVFVLAFIGFGAASQMAALKSQAGNTVAEAFYNAFGLWATALIGIALVVGIASVLRLSSQNRQLWLIERQQLLLMVHGTDAAWHSDPTGRHELRYWNGQKWTPSITDHGVPGDDPV